MPPVPNARRQRSVRRPPQTETLDLVHLPPRGAPDARAGRERGAERAREDSTTDVPTEAPRRASSPVEPPPMSKPFRVAAFSLYGGVCFATLFYWYGGVRSDGLAEELLPPRYRGLSSLLWAATMILFCVAPAVVLRDLRLQGRLPTRRAFQFGVVWIASGLSTFVAAVAFDRVSDFSIGVAFGVVAAGAASIALAVIAASTESGRASRP
jgi:hypothetical protein